MPPRKGTSNRDYYPEHRCLNCRHLRYANQEPGDPCLFCSCTEHVTPADYPGGDAA